VFYVVSSFQAVDSLTRLEATAAGPEIMTALSWIANAAVWLVTGFIWYQVFRLFLR
jgi:hypothetical protein